MRGNITMSYQVVNKHIDTLIVNVKGKLPDGMAAQLDSLQEAAKEIESDVVTAWQFRGHTIFIKPHGAKNWRWILTCGDSYLHLDVSKGRLNGIIAKVRFSSLLLHELGTGEALAAVYRFLVVLFGEGFALQVSEVHLCMDIAGWALSLDDVRRFVSQGRAKAARVAAEDESPIVRFTGRRCTEIKFSQGAPHSCDIYDKTLEVKSHGKQWFYEVWKANGWDGESTITRVEFRYKRECLHEMGIECPYDMLDQLSEMWAYSTQKWLRHTVPDADTNQSRWATSEVWELVQAGFGADEATPLARRKKVELDTERSKAGFVGYATSWAMRAVWLYEVAQADQATEEDEAALVGLPLDEVQDDGGGFLSWAYDQMQAYLKKRKAASFTEVMELKAQKLEKLLKQQRVAA